MADVLDLFRKIATLEAELRIEKAQHANAQQTIVYLSCQLAKSLPEIVRNVPSCQPTPVPSPQEHLVAEAQSTAAPTQSHHKTQPGRDDTRMQPDDFQAHLHRIKAWNRAEESASASHGINASKWAQRRSPELVQISKDEQKKQGPVEEDLINFQDGCEESDARGNGKTGPVDDAGERERQEDIRRTQAMLMFRPKAGRKDHLRTVMATGIPPDMNVAEVMSLVSGGIIVSVQPMHTSPITSTESIMITFLRASQARGFVESAKDNKSPEFCLLNTPTWPLNRDLLYDITEGKHTRCLVVYNLDPDIPLGNLCVILAEGGTTEHGIIRASRDPCGTVFLEFVSVAAAQKAHGRARRHARFRISRIEFDADPCDRAAAKKEGRETTKEEAAETGTEATGATGAEVAADGETEAGAEAGPRDDTEADACAGADMDDHEIATTLADAY